MPPCYDVRMGWKLTASVVTDDGAWTETYSDTEVRSPEFARGFVCGAAWAHGIPADLVQFKLEET